MNAVSPTQLSQRRYRRRILGWGAVGVLAIFAGGAAIFGNRVEDDLERRVTAVLDGELTGVVTVQFRGQDGTLFCDSGPVEVPPAVLEEARDVWGVHRLNIDDGCLIADGADDAESVSGDETATTDSAPTQTEPTSPATTGTTGERLPADVGTVVDVIANDSQFSILEGLIGDAAFDERLVAEGRFTVFAPTDAAFEALGPDVVARLRDDPDLLASVLGHLVTGGALRAADLVEGDIEMLDGTTVTVSFPNGPAVNVTLTSADTSATLIEADLLASNGVVHAVHQVLLPVGAVVGDAEEIGVRATLRNGQIELSGRVASEAQRAELVNAGSTQLDGANVIDSLIVDPDSTIADSQVADVATIVAAMVPNMTEGTVVVTDDGVSLGGIYLDAAALAAIESATSGVDQVVVDLAERRPANAAEAGALTDDLNRLVASTPIQFDPNSADITASSDAVLDQIAAIANRVGGVLIEIQGHTDTDGLAATNQRLSEGRATAVLTALADRGVSVDVLSALGFGGSQPVLDPSGAEDKVASRRVEFVVTSVP